MKIEGSKYVFEAKAIQKMEIVILSTLEWKMNPVTPLSFLDYITRRLGLETYISSEFLNRCECLLLCFLPGNKNYPFLMLSYKCYDILIYIVMNKFVKMQMVGLGIIYHQ